MFIKQGTKITCENGHDICEVGYDISTGSIIRSSNFINFKDGNNEPISCTPIFDQSYNCVKCGGKWIRPHGHYKINLHIKDEGWLYGDNNN